MKRRSNLFSFFGIVAVAVFGVVYTLIRGWSPGLGLDLQGGASVVLRPDTKVDTNVLEQAKQIIRNRVDALGVAEPEVVRQGDNILVQLPGLKDPERALALVGQTAELRFRPVLNDNAVTNALLQNAVNEATSGTSTTAPGGSTTTAPSGSTTTTAGGASTTATGSSTFPPTTASATTASATTASATTTSATTTRVGPAFDVAGGPGRFVVRAAASAASTTTLATTLATSAATTTTAATTGASTTSAAGTGTSTTVVGAVAATAPGVSTTLAGASTTVAGASTTTTKPGPTTTLSKAEEKKRAEEQLKALEGILTPAEKDLPNGPVILAERDKNKASGDLKQVYSLGPSELTGRAVKTASAVVNPQGQWEIQVEFTAEGSKEWDAMAQRNFQRQVAIVLDGIVLSAPVIQAQQFNGEAVISGTFTSAEAKDLGVALRYGSLPVVLKQQTVQTVSATLGRDALNAGLITGLIGLALVAIYMIFYYRALGLVVIFGLSVSAALMWSLVSWLSESRGLALTLSGAVGIIVSVGITVDSYVVYFERLRDEVRSGKTLRSSIDRGFKRAFRTILAADSASFIGAAVLYLRTVGSVRGFAFFLALSTLLDVIVAWFFTRPLVSMVGQTRFFTDGPLGVVRTTRGASSSPRAAASTGGGGIITPSGGKS